MSKDKGSKLQDILDFLQYNAESLAILLFAAAIFLFVLKLIFIPWSWSHSCPSGQDSIEKTSIEKNISEEKL